MRKLSRDSIYPIIKRACKEFMEDDSSSSFVSFFYKGRYVDAFFVWSSSAGLWYLDHFDIVGHRRVMRYEVNVDYDMGFAWCW